MDGGVLFVMVVVAVVGLSTAQTKYCCTPDQWQGLLSVTTGITQREHGKLAQEVTHVYYDYTNQRSALFVNATGPNGRVLSYEDLVVYSGPNSGTFYKLDLRTRKCFAIKLSVPFIKFCVPDSAGTLWCAV